MRCLLAEGDADFERCQAGIDGGAIYTSASIAFGVGGPGKRARTAISSNSASGNGGGVMAFSSVAELQVDSCLLCKKCFAKGCGDNAETLCILGFHIPSFYLTGELQVESGYSLLFEDNRASLDGGGIAFDQGVSVSLALEGCNPLICSPSSIGNGICDAPCLYRGCNWLIPVPCWSS